MAAIRSQWHLFKIFSELSTPFRINIRPYRTPGCCIFMTSCRSGNVILNIVRRSGSWNNNALKLSESCIKRLKEMKNDGSYLRVSVDGGGCSGFQYKFSLENEKSQDDIVITSNDVNVNVLVDETSLDLLKGSTLDYEEELIRSGFRIINNPLAEQGCSCGASFSLKIT